MVGHKDRSASSVIGRIKSDRVPGWSLWCCSVIGGRLTGCSMVGLAETVLYGGG